MSSTHRGKKRVLMPMELKLLTDGVSQHVGIRNVAWLLYESTNSLEMLSHVFKRLPYFIYLAVT